MPPSQRHYERAFEHRGQKVIRLKSGRLLTYWAARDAADRAETALISAVVRVSKLAEGDDYSLEHLHDRLEGLDDWVHAVLKAVEKQRDELAKAERAVARLAAMRNTTGRTPAEAAAFNRKADEIERRTP